MFYLYDGFISVLNIVLSVRHYELRTVSLYLL